MDENRPTFVNKRGVYLVFEPDQYEILLQDKVLSLKSKFAEYFQERKKLIGSDEARVEVFSSVSSHYRQRCRMGCGAI